MKGGDSSEDDVNAKGFGLESLIKDKYAKVLRQHSKEDEEVKEAPVDSNSKDASFEIIDSEDEFPAGS